LLFGGLLFKLLTKIYYSIFRLKKSELTSRAAQELLRNQLVYLFIIVLSLGFILKDLINPAQPGDRETKIPQTIMANLVTSESEISPDEQLIEETATPSSSNLPDKEKYLDNSCTLTKDTDLTNIDTAAVDQINPEDLLAFNDDGDAVFKPTITETSETTKGSSTAQTQQRKKVIDYIVQNGDTISSIARRFGLTINTIVWANNLSNSERIRPGDTLSILPYSGILYTVKSGDTISKIAKRYNVDDDKILSCNDLGGSLKIGQKIIVPGAKKISEAVAVTRNNSNNNYTGLSAIRDLIKTPAPKVTGGRMVWPTSGHNITQYFSWHHPGVDIANHIGTPIYAADSGVVEIARGGWNGGYGNTILLNHGNGKKTRYGHASKLYVHAGQEVDKGELIAAMGSTGHSTGPHLHFEVIIGNVKYNPLNYVR
jgi:murein DD-endopeptidase MepM/ murein hydrolase activator NlpD